MTNLFLNSISGIVRTADAADDMNLEKILKATQNNKALPVTWTHDDLTNQHKFKVDSVIRGENESKVVITWDGSPLEVRNKGEETVKIPSVNDFSAIEAKTVQGNQQYISIRFSDPLLANQDLTGLVTIDKASDYTCEIDGMFIKVYPSSLQSGTITVNVEAGIKNAAKARLKTKQSFEVLFETIKPSVKFIGKGNIIPASKGLVIPFSAVNIKAVNLKIIKIFENNINQFLQVNQLEGTYELKRAGRLILKKTIRLDSGKKLDLSHWNNFSIDLANLIKQEPGAIYRVELSFSKKYSIYPCSDGNDESGKDNLTQVNDEENNLTDNEIAYWEFSGNNYYDDYEYDYGYNYNWQEKDDPCKDSYYRGNNVSAAKNILASDFGIIAKGGADHSLLVAVTNLVTTKPLSGIDIEVYDYQNQKIAEGKTDGDGLSNIALSEKPFLVIAKEGDQRGYLRVDDGSALSLSNFDVSGETVQKGIKGFIYGERGVWRPGDTIFLNFILEDKIKKLPENHPVVLEIYNPQGQLYKRLVKTVGVNGFYMFNVVTTENDPTGNWLANIKIGGTTFTKTLKIESIKPNRLKIQFNLGDAFLKGPVRATLNAKWLHGAPAKNMKASVAVTLYSSNTSFKGYEGYTFDDPLKKYQYDEKSIFEGILDDKGDVFVRADIDAGSNAPGFLKANFVTRVFEPGGDFSIDRFSLPFSPYTFLRWCQSYLRMNGGTYIPIQASCLRWSHSPRKGCLLTGVMWILRCTNLNGAGGGTRGMTTWLILQITPTLNLCLKKHLLQLTVRQA